MYVIKRTACSKKKDRDTESLKEHYSLIFVVVSYIYMYTCTTLEKRNSCYTFNHVASILWSPCSLVGAAKRMQYILKLMDTEMG